MLKGFVTETQHLYQQQASQQIDDSNRRQQTYIGYLGNYNPQTGYGTVVNPENCDDNGVPIITGPIPIITAWIGVASGQNPITGNNEPWGIQICPFGGSAAQNLTGGEQVLVIQARAEIGYGATGFLLPNNLALPPGGDQIPILGRQIAPGEMLIVTPAQSVILLDAEGSTHVYQQQVNGDGGNFKVGVAGGVRIQTTAPQTLIDDPDEGEIDIQALQDLFLQSQQGDLNAEAELGDVNISALTGDINELANADITRTTTTGNIIDTAGQNIVGTAAGTILLGAGLSMQITANGLIQINAAAVNAGNPALTYLPLLTAFFLTLYNSHTHAGVQSGAGVTGPPVVTAIPNYPVATNDFFAN